MANGNGSSDIGNQLAGVNEGLDRFLEALDASSMGLGSQDALKKIQARAEIKRLDQEKRFKTKIEKMEKTRLKQLTESIKSMKIFNKNMGDMAKKGLSKGMGMIKGAMKAGAIGALVVGIKAIVDGMLQIDGMMAKVVAGTGRLRSGLQGIRGDILEVSDRMSYLGVTMEHAGAEAVNLSQQFGRISMVTSDLIELSLQMQKGFGMSAESTGQILESLTRINVDAKEFVLSLREGAVMAGTNVALVMRNIATITKDISVQNSRSVESLKEMAIQAARAGVGVEELNKMGDAFTDPAQIGENIGKAAQVLGGSIGKLNPFKLWNLADQPSQIGKLNETVLSHLGTTVKLSKEGNLVMQDGTEIRRHQLKAMTDLSGMTGEATLRLLKQHEQWVAIGHVTDLQGKNLTKNAGTWADIQDMALEASKWEDATEKDAKKRVKLDDEAQKKKYKDLLIEMKQYGKISKEVAAVRKQREQEAKVADAMNQTIRESQTILERVKHIFFGVFSDITKEMGELFGFDSNDPDSLRATIDGLSKYIKDALDMGSFAEDVNATEGMNKFEAAWEQLKKRMLPIFNDIAASLGQALAAGIGNAFDAWWNDSTAGKVWNAIFSENVAEAAVVGGAVGGGVPGAVIGSQIQIASNLYDAFKETQEEAQAELVAKEKQLEGLEYNEANFDLITDLSEQILELQSSIAEREAAANPEAELAKGGLVTRPTHALIGEAGPELVLPLGGGATRILPLSGTQRFQDGGDIIPLSAGMFTGITTTGGGLTGSGSEARRSEVAAANMAETRRQQAPMMEYWRREYDRRLDEMTDRDNANRKSWQDYAKQFFLKYETEVGVALGKAFGTGPAGKEMSKALMTGMNAWSNGASAKEGLSLGIRAGLTESMKEGGTMDKFFKRHDNVLMTGLQEGLQTFARTGSLKQAGRSIVAGGARAIAKKYMGDKAMGAAAQYMGQAAGGRVVNSPGLFMAGEGGNREIIVPTDRIRKGLPINSSVAHELSSIGVPGYQDGFADSFKGKSNPPPKPPPALGIPKGQTLSSGGYGAGVSGRFSEMGGFGGMAKAGGAGALMSFADTFQQTGSWGQAATAGVGSGAGVGIGMGLTALGVPPPLSTMAGQFAGQLITKGLNKAFGLTGGYGKGRRRAAKSIEQHIKSGGVFDFGQPSGLTQAVNLAIGGREKTPTESNYQKLVDRLNKIKGLARAGVDATGMIGLATGKITGPRAMDTYKKMNIALYGSAAGDKYMKAVAMPQLGRGGIVTKPTIATVGEGGPEMIVPLHEQRTANDNLLKEMKEQNKLMKTMIKTQKETGSADIIMDGRKVAEAVSENFYDIGTGI